MYSITAWQSFRYGLLMRKDEQRGGFLENLNQLSTAWVVSGVVTAVCIVIGLLTLLYFFYSPMSKIVL